MTEPDWAQYETIVGRRWSRYATRFERFARGGWLSWNWGAFFGTLAWLRYRKLYSWSWAYFFISTPVLLSGLAIVHSSRSICERALEQTTDVFSIIVIAILVLGWILPPLFADRLYFAGVGSLVRKGAGADSKHAGTGSVAGALGLQFLMIAVVVVGLPSYGNYTYHARVSEGVALASSLKTPIAEYLAEHGHLPGGIEEISEPISSTYVRNITVSADGTIRVEFSEQGELLNGHSILVKPRIGGRAIEEWTCRSQDLPNECLPTTCRG